MTVETYQVTMGDSVRLATDMYLPEGEGPWPVLVARTPYRRQQLRALGTVLAARGYAVMLQDVRGTGDSEGQFRMYRHEPADALQTARWLLEQPWCDGRLGILGISYLAGAALAIAAEMPERVTACIWLTMPVRRDLLAFENGAYRLHHSLPWSMLLTGDGPPLKPRDWGATYATLPLSAAADNELWHVFVENEEPGSPFWRENDLGPYLAKVKAPGLHAGGWYCMINDATVEPFRLLNASAGTAQHLLIGPWSHNGILPAPEFQAAMAAWLDHWFKGTPLDMPPVRLLPAGEGAEWLSLDRWPEPVRPLYLAPGGHLTAAPPDPGTECFTADPLKPVPTQGGAVWEFAPAGLIPGPLPQTTAERPDVLAYRTEPLTEPLTLCGTARLELWASASTPDADFTAKLTDIAPDGTARYICDSIIRARYRGGLDSPQALTPGDLCRFVIPMHLGHRLEAGHRLGLEVAGFNFPKYSRNLHHGGSHLQSGADQALVSERVVALGKSVLVLPAVD